MLARISYLESIDNGANVLERSPSSSTSFLSPRPTGDFGGENARLCTSIRGAAGDLVEVALGRFIPAGGPFFGTGLEDVRVVVSGRGVVVV